MVELFDQYKNIQYKVCESIVKGSKLNSLDYIRIHVNNTYAYMFDKEVYYNKQYYKSLYAAKHEYFKLVKNQANLDKVDINKLKNKIENAMQKATEIKQQSIDKKYDLSWEEYQGVIEKCIYKCFENYKPVEEWEEEHEWEDRVYVDCWNEDNYIISYFNKCITGTIKDYIKDITGFYDKHRYQTHLKKYINIDVAKDYTALQLCVSKFYNTKEELLEKANDNNFIKLTKRQKQFINQLKEIITYNKEEILFTKNGLPCINEDYISEKMKKPRTTLVTMLEKINNSINKKEKQGYKFCIECGKQYKSNSNKSKYCKICARKINIKKTILNRKYKKSLK